MVRAGAARGKEPNMHVTCTRCAKSSESFDPPAWPEGWEGSVSEAVCPGCQYVEWHPLCEGIVDFGGRRVDLSVIARNKIDPNRLSRCEYLDLTVAWIGDNRVGCQNSVRAARNQRFAGRTLI